ncbi:MAG: site-specific DNA-methyltransferase [Bacteroidales bacterium]|nr:site-specific DNA-methyltransferase [Bacteroidales bacterium]
MWSIKDEVIFFNDIVLDPFMGSGTTAIAALKNRRKYIGYEISEEYVKIANNRIANVGALL